MKNALIISASGIGDALLMMIASHRLLQEDYLVKTIHPLIGEMNSWFPGHTFGSTYDEHDIAKADIVIVQNDNSARIRYFKNHVMRGKVSFFYPTYHIKKHGPLSSKDQVFNPDIPMADNIAASVARLLSSQHISKNNGLVTPSHLVHRKYLKRVAIHPTSADSRKNWDPKKYRELASILKEHGYEPHFTVSPKEMSLWKDYGISTPLFATLNDLAAFLYESGYAIGNDSVVGHLSSNLLLPTLIIADNPIRMRLWRPGWQAGSVVTPPPWIPNSKFLRLRRNHWRKWISVKRVMGAFEELV